MGRNTVPVVLPVPVQSSSFVPEILRSHFGKTLFMKQLGALSNEAWIVNIPYIYPRMAWMTLSGTTVRDTQFTIRQGGLESPGPLNQHI